jgi:hypothetical protein
MKKQAMSLAVTAALLGGAVSATGSMYIDDGGLGETLIYPFYSAVNGNDTYIHLVNTTDLVKAVKVRFVEAQNSQEVLDFNLYLSPRDEWAGVITRNPLLGADAGAIIRTVDTSCTVPTLGTGSTGTTNGLVKDQAFTNLLYVDDDELPAGDAADTTLARTMEGYIEVIEMGQLLPTSDLGAAAVHAQPAGVPADCAALVAAWSVTGGVDGAWLDDAQTDLLTAWDGGGLYGYGVLINVDGGYSSGYEAVAIEGFADADLGSPNLHFPPGDSLPGLNNATTDVILFDGVDAIDYEMSTGIDAVSALFQTATLSNDYVIDPDLNALTDWVITMPTKSFYTQGPDAATPPFTSVWDGAEACEPISLQYWNREENTPGPETDGPVFSPSQDPDQEVISLCTEVTVLTWGSGEGEPSAIGVTDAIRNGIQPDAGYIDGWAQIGFTLPLPTLTSPDRTLAATTPAVDFLGLPVTGFAVFKYENGTLADGTVLANYAASIDHKTEQDQETPNVP